MDVHFTPIQILSWIDQNHKGAPLLFIFTGEVGTWPSKNWLSERKSLRSGLSLSIDVGAGMPREDKGCDLKGSTDGVIQARLSVARRGNSLSPLPGLANGLQYFLPRNAFSQARHIKGRPATGSFRRNGKHIAFATPDDHFFALGLLKNIRQLLPSLRVGIDLHRSLHHLYSKTSCNITHAIIKANQR
jgi:hypothetical protein